MRSFAQLTKRAAEAAVIDTPLCDWTRFTTDAR
jgi:hypothetical protein